MKKEHFFILMAVAIFGFGFGKVVGGEAPVVLPSAEQESLSMQNSKEIEQIRLDLRSAMANVKDAELDDFEKQLFPKDAKKEDAPLAYEQMKAKLSNRTEVIPLLLAGMERRPKQTGWSFAIWTRSSSDNLEIKSLPLKEKKAYGSYTLAYLHETLEMVQNTFWGSESGRAAGIYLATVG